MTMTDLLYRNSCCEPSKVKSPTGSEFKEGDRVFFKYSLGFVASKIYPMKGTLHACSGTVIKSENTTIDSLRICWDNGRIGAYNCELLEHDSDQREDVAREEIREIPVKKQSFKKNDRVFYRHDPRTKPSRYRPMQKTKHACFGTIITMSYISKNYSEVRWDNAYADVYPNRVLKLVNPAFEPQEELGSNDPNQTFKAVKQNRRVMVERQRLLSLYEKSDGDMEREADE